MTALATLFAGVVAAMAAHSAPATPAVSLTGEKAVAQLKESGQYDSLSAAYEAARHAVRADEAAPDGVLHAQNPGHGLSATFDRHGLQLSVQRHGSEGERLTTRWRLASVGREGSVVEVPAGDALRRDGQRAEIVRAGLGLTEWFVNRPSGLEHGFTLERRPAGAGVLRLEIAIEGDLRPVPSADGQRIELHDVAGAKVLDYNKLRVWDAAGRELPARMERAAAGGLRFQVEDAGARYPLTVDPTFAQQAYLKASNPGANDLFGWSVAVSGNTVVVGAILEASSTTNINSLPNDAAAGAGAAYVFVRSGSTWTQQAYLKASNAGMFDQFGYSVAVSGDTVVVGAVLEASSTTNINSRPNDAAAGAGAAYVFVRSGTNWTQQAYLKAFNAGAGDNFGHSVAVSSNTVVVGAFRESSGTRGINSTPNEDAAGAGAAYVFVRSGTTWTQQAYLKAFNPGANDNFGHSVAVSSNTVVVGAFRESSSTTGINSTPNEDAAEAGAAYVFVRSGTNWTEQAYLKASNAGTNDNFGQSVGVSGDTVVVGANNEDGDASSASGNPNNNISGAGAAYVFVRSGTNWSQQAYLKASNPGTNDNFGQSVGVSGDTVVIGANNESGVGAAFVFLRGGTDWSQQAYLKASNPGTNDQFGNSVAVAGDTVAVGAYLEDSGTMGINTTPNEGVPDAGAAFVFYLIPDPKLTSVSPNIGPTAGGTFVTLTGTNFTGATGVTFGGIAATNVVVVNATNITCITPPRAAGAVSVVVTTPGGTSAANTLFTYGGLPVVNPGAENPVLVAVTGPNSFTRNNPGWSELTASTDTTGIVRGGAAQNPLALEGNNWFWIDSRTVGGLYQQVGTIAADTTYTLKIIVGVPFTNFIPRASYFRFGLFAGTNATPTSPVAVATEANVTAGSGQNQTFSLTFSSVTGNPFVGQNLFIMMEITTRDVSARQIFFEDISLTATAGANPPNTAPSFTLAASPDPSVTTLAGSGVKGSDDGTGAAARFRYPFGVAVDSAGNVYVGDLYNYKIRKITPAGVVTTLAGSGEYGFADGPGTAASFDQPAGVAVDSAGNVYVADSFNHEIRKITPAGVVTRLAGSAVGVSEGGFLVGGFADGTGAAASFNYPMGVAVDSAGNVYVGDLYNHKIRKITPAGEVTTLAGSGDEGNADGTATAASFSGPRGVAVDSAGNVYVGDSDNHKIRKITPAGEVTTLAGSGVRGSDDGPGTAASFSGPRGVAVDSAGNVYVADRYNHKIRKITPAGEVTTLAGYGVEGSADGTGTAAWFKEPHGVAVDSAGNVYVADTGNNKIRKITPAGVVTTAGGGAFTRAGFASNISPGPAADSGQTVSFTVTADNPALFSVLPAIASDGTFTFTPAPSAVGSSLITVTAMDNGGKAKGGVDTSAPQTFAITLVPNVAPTVSFTPPSVAVAQGAGAKTVPNFATFHPGPDRESYQALVGYTVTVDTTDNGSLFSAAPAIANNGTLTFTPAAGQSGSATLKVVAKDNGGTIGGGVDQSTRTFTLRVVASQFVVTDASQLQTALTTASSSGTTILLAGNVDLGPVVPVTKSVRLVAGLDALTTGVLKVGSGGNVNLGGGNLPGVSITVQSGGILSGSGSFSGMLEILFGGWVRPGDSPGTIGADDGIWAGGATYDWEIKDAGGAPGAADLLVFNNTLKLTATPANRFIVRLKTLAAGNAPGRLPGFDPQADYAWTIAHAGSVVGFNASAFTLDTTGFANATGGGVFGIRQSAGDIQVTFTTDFRPALRVMQVGTSLTLSWPSANTADYELEETTTLEDPSSWRPVIDIADNDGTTRSVTLDSTGILQGFYRLRKP